MPVPRDETARATESASPSLGQSEVHDQVRLEGLVKNKGRYSPERPPQSTCTAAIARPGTNGMCCTELLSHRTSCTERK